MSNFFINIKKTNGAEFEPDTLSTIHRGIARYLASKNYTESRKVIKAKRRSLCSQCLGNLPNATRNLTDDEEDMLFEKVILGFITRSP